MITTFRAPTLPLALTAALSLTINTAVAAGVCGDIDNSGTVTVADAICTTLAVLAESAGDDYPDCASASADHNCDGSITLQDVQAIVSLALGFAPLGDLDGDGCVDACQVCDPNDFDCDGVLDGDDNCPEVENPGQENADGDSMGNDCDPDADNDGLDNETEFMIGSDWLVKPNIGIGTPRIDCNAAGECGASELGECAFNNAVNTPYFCIDMTTLSCGFQPYPRADNFDKGTFPPEFLYVRTIVTADQPTADLTVQFDYIRKGTNVSTGPLPATAGEFITAAIQLPAPISSGTGLETYKTGSSCQHLNLDRVRVRVRQGGVNYDIASQKLFRLFSNASCSGTTLTCSWP